MFSSPPTSLRRSALAAVIVLTAGVLPATVASTMANPGPGISIKVTLRQDDGSGLCSETDDSVLVAPGTPVLVCYTAINTGDEALSLHTVTDSALGVVMGPDDVFTLDAGNSVRFTHSATWNATTVHDVVWEAVGEESDLGVIAGDTATIEVEEPEISLEMTVMVDDGTETCGTDTALLVPAGTALRYCYTMTVIGDEAVNVHDLDDDHLGVLLADLDDEAGPGESVVHTEVFVIEEPALHTGTWAAIGSVSGVEATATDSLQIDVTPAPPTTTTLPPCEPATTVTDPPTTTVPETTTSTTTTSTTTTSTTTTTTSTTTSTTTTTTFPVFVARTTSTSTPVPVPAGFAAARSVGQAGPCAPPLTLPPTR